MNSIGLAIAVALLIAGQQGESRVEQSELGAPGAEATQAAPAQPAEQPKAKPAPSAPRTSNEPARSGRSVAAFWFVG